MNFVIVKAVRISGKLFKENDTNTGMDDKTEKNENCWKTSDNHVVISNNIISDFTLSNIY